ncbi:uncharacterized protein BJ212DRAFT_1268161, partial [Suillus subaureus]
RYHPRNLILYGITPGSKELDANQLQLFMKNYVDDLLCLYDERITLKTQKYPNGKSNYIFEFKPYSVAFSGRCVPVILVAVCCDHPAMCKVCGFGSHSKKEGFCSCCHILQSELRTKAGFPRRDGEQHKKHAREYANLESKERDKFFTKHSARWFELIHLPYFDPIRMTVIDPMHCFCLVRHINVMHLS